MTTAKAPHRAARTLLLRHLDMHPGKTVNNDLDPAEVGIVGDTAHAAGGDSYHLGKDQIRARNGDNRYSVDESSRDRNGLDNNASGMDVGWFDVTTRRGRYTLRDFSMWLVELCADGDPDTRDIREVIFSPDGKVVRRWDRLKRRSSGDRSHLSHTHISEFRDASGTRMVKLVTRWLQRIGLLPEGDDMPTVQEILTAKVTLQKDANGKPTQQWGLGDAIGYAARKSYEAVRDLGAFVTAETARDAQTAATLAGMKTALTAVATANGALTSAQVAALTDQVRQAATAAGTAATATVEAKIDALRKHLGDDAPTGS
ncbi:hypothetical protein [Actinoplanes sp. NPDC049599]|uniref:hypothetical protein n=1 Tax=Actinoplanes sp. NPDC049599 TaxID=3363903 RepID=UPI0037A02BE2